MAWEGASMNAWVYPHRHFGLALCRLAWRLLSARPGAGARAGPHLPGDANGGNQWVALLAADTPKLSGLARRHARDFVFSVKGSRYITHMLRLDSATRMVAIANFFASGLLLLGANLGPILW